MITQFVADYSATPAAICKNYYEFHFKWSFDLRFWAWFDNGPGHLVSLSIFSFNDGAFKQIICQPKSAAILWIRYNRGSFGSFSDYLPESPEVAATLY